jgi:hypothetical protein
VHISYKAQLKSYKKKYFDPFKRREKFHYHFKVNNKTIHTTIGQLNFFRWAIENKIIEYINDNFDNLSKDMNVSNKDDKRRKKEKHINKQIKNIKNVPNKTIDKKNIGIKVSKQIDNEIVKIILTFD